MKEGESSREGANSNSSYSREEDFAWFNRAFDFMLCKSAIYPRDYIVAKKAMYDALDRSYQIEPRQIGLINFLIERECENSGADNEQMEEIKNVCDSRIPASSYDKAIEVFNSLPEHPEIDSKNRLKIRKVLENRRKALEAPIAVKPAPSIGSVRKEAPFFKRRTKSMGPKA